MVLKLNVKEHKDNITVKELSNFNIPDTLVVGLTPAEPYKKLKELYDLGVSIIGFVGCVIIGKDKLDQEVPSNFANSTIQLDDETTRQKTWREYTLTHEKENDASILIGYRDENGNRSSEVSDDELRNYIEHFGIETIKHKYDYLDYIEVDESKTLE